ncbi:spore coat protein [Clostridium sp. CX1]|uniref:Spore coat protein n=1 Tax=Clostridium tanneri TaxID=3037988 RepID=A0ABU4JQ38_9CLOT|nr:MULTISPECIES: spore coat protein [unclassified Clostridium]MCT8978461.1 spore coat protein [Clostridium sp. CX1]MDW8800245.1 spore coat protein [Clostridium sp. A1-XYC3]
MNSILEGITGMDKMSDQVIATDFLIAAKSGIKNYSVALSETASPEVRNVLRRQLDDAINMHERITNYMMDNGYYHAYNPQEQFKVDMKVTDTALSLAD